MIEAPRDAMGFMVNPIDALFRPRSIAVIGATDKPPKRGASVLVNLMTNACGASVYPVNPQHVTVFDRACYPSILDVPGRVDLAVIATHATAIPEIIGQCIQAKVRAAIGLASTFRERGPDGGSLENAVLEQARAAGLRVLGPNSLGLMLPGHEKISEQSVYTRYTHAFRLAGRIAHEYLSRMCFIDYLREMALVALHTNARGEPEIVGVGRLLMERNRNEAEFAVLISDEFQGRGMGTELLRRLVEIGRKEHVARIVGYILMNNTPMLHACTYLGFHHEHELGDPMVQSIIDLRP
jgi:RimJ/RimL family protein N-acetyltransferase